MSDNRFTWDDEDGIEPEPFDGEHPEFVVEEDIEEDEIVLPDEDEDEDEE